MRIGQVAKKYNISLHNIYYYIDFGLIVPSRPKGQYEFDKNTLKDLELIIDLKKLDFSLKEIHNILSLYRVSNLAHQQDIEDLKTIYYLKRSATIAEKQRLEQSIEELDKKINELNLKYSSVIIPTGVPLEMINLLACPKCGCRFHLNNVTMNQRYIFNGNLNCNCGHSAIISEGILLTQNKNTSLYDTPDLTRELYKCLPAALISLFQRSYNWMVDKLNQIDLSNKVIMETYINAWFFLHNHLQYLSPKAKYIVVDKYPETLIMYKKFIEINHPEMDVLYIADSSTCLPIVNNCVNINIDYFACNEHNFYKHTFLLDELKPYLTKDGIALGTYFYFDKGYQSMKNLIMDYPEAYNLNFNKTVFLDKSAKSGFNCIEYIDVGFTTDSGSNLGFNFHEKGEKMYLMPYLYKNNHEF